MVKKRSAKLSIAKHGKKSYDFKLRVRPLIPKRRDGIIEIVELRRTIRAPIEGEERDIEVYVKAWIKDKQETGRLAEPLKDITL